jgi:hypothetical protein
LQDRIFADADAAVEAPTDFWDSAIFEGPERVPELDGAIEIGRRIQSRVFDSITNQAPSAFVEELRSEAVIPFCTPDTNGQKRKNVEISGLRWGNQSSASLSKNTVLM